MYTGSSLQERCQRILEENGGLIADQASRILLEDPALKDLHPPLELIFENWREPLTPSLMKLACEAVKGRSEATYEAALAMNLIHLSFYTWDNMIDKATYRSFKPTVFGKFGEGASLIIGGLASAKAFSILNQMDVNQKKRQTVIELVWEIWTKMAQAETVNLGLRSSGNFSAKKKLWVIKTEAVDLGNCLRVGAVLGNGSEEEVEHLGMYGEYLGIMLELRKDFEVFINLTLELAQKIKSRALPFSLLWASQRSKKIQKKLEDLAHRNTIIPSDIKEIVKDALRTRTLSNTTKIIRKTAKKAKEELLQLNKNRATQTLKFFVEAQPQLFIESLSDLQSKRS